MGRKATNLEAQQRVDVVYDLISRCYSNQEILQYASTEWGIGDRQTHHYIEQARAQMKADAHLHRAEALDRQLANYRKIIKDQSAPGGSVRLVLEALKRESELLGLQASRKLPVLEALQLLVNEGLATPQQLQTVSNGLNQLIENLRSPASGDGAIASPDHPAD